MYFDVFRHPLTIAELVRLIDPHRSMYVEQATEQLVNEHVIQRQGNHVFRHGMHENIPRRNTRARAAEKLWPRARRSAAWLYRIPYVRGVLVTGSLSKNSTQSDDDIDFMVLVEPGQVWTLKTLLQGMRKIMPSGLRECFCTNHLLDISKPIIDDQNMFCAIELATAMPMVGRTAIVSLLEANRDWVVPFVPGFDWSIERAKMLRPNPDSRIRIPRSEWVEAKSMALWSRYWDRKYHWLDEKTRTQSFKRRPELATNHLHDYQRYVLDEVTRRLEPIGVGLPKPNNTVG